MGSKQDRSVRAWRAVALGLVAAFVTSQVFAGFGGAQGGQGGGGGGGDASAWSENVATQNVDMGGFSLHSVDAVLANSAAFDDNVTATQFAVGDRFIDAGGSSGNGRLGGGNWQLESNSSFVVPSGRYYFGSGSGVSILSGHDESGSPEGVVSAARGSLYLDNTSSTDTLWIKTGTGTTGWRRVTFSTWATDQDANTHNITNVQGLTTKGNVTFGDATSDTVTVTGVLYATRSITTVTGNQTGTDDTYYRGQVYLFAGVSGAKTWDLSDATVGAVATWIVDDTDGWTLYAAAGDTVRISGTVTASGGGISSTAVGSTVTLLKVASNEWIATSAQGTWSTVAAP